MSESGIRTILFLHWRLARSWLRRSARSPLFWLIAAALAFVLLSMVASAFESGPGDNLRGLVTDAHYAAAAAAVFSAAILIGLWRGASSSPRTSLADVVIMMRSPVSRRAQYAYLMIRDAAQSGLAIALWATAGFGGVMVQTGDHWLPARVAFLVLVSVLLSVLLRFALWAPIEQLAARDPRLANWLRRTVRAGVVLAAGALTTYLCVPLYDERIADWGSTADALIGRAMEIASFPPMSWTASVLNGDGSALAAAVGLTLLTAAVAALALLGAREFLEPLAVNAERTTDARGKMTEPGADVQWASMAQLGVSPNLKVSIRPFGLGPWAILWASLVRWLRYEIAAAWVGLLLLGGFGAIVAFVIRLDYMPVYLGWGVAVIMPLLSSVNAFLDELRKQFLFLTPGPVWQRLVSGAVTSALDGTIAGLLVILALMVVRVISLLEAAGLLVLCLAPSVVSQGAVAMVQVILPYWVPHRMRITVTVVASVIAGLPALSIGVAIYLVGSAIIGMVVAAMIAMLSGAAMFAVGAIFFNRVEFTE